MNMDSLEFQKHETPLIRSSVNRSSMIRSAISGLNDYSRMTSKTTNIHLTQLASDILSIVAQGEKSVSLTSYLTCLKSEIIRKVLFELKDFSAY